MQWHAGATHSNWDTGEPPGSGEHDHGQGAKSTGGHHHPRALGNPTSHGGRATVQCTVRGSPKKGEEDEEDEEHRGEEKVGLTPIRAAPFHPLRRAPSHPLHNFLKGTGR